jgi:hypothetical protein
MISRFKDFVTKPGETFFLKMKSAIFGNKEKMDRFYLIDLYKHLDENVDDYIDEIKIKYTDEGVAFSQILVSFYKNNFIYKSAILNLFNGYCSSIVMPLNDIPDIKLRNLIERFLVENGLMDEEEEEIEEEEEEEIEEMEESKSEVYKALYITPLIVDKSYCYIFDFYDDDFKRNIIKLCSFINNKYRDVIISPLIKSPHPGLVVNKEANIQHISTDIYQTLEKYGIPCRVVYSEGEISVLNKDIHRCSGKLVIKIGKESDRLKNKKGIFRA